MTADLLAGEPTRPLRREEYDRLVDAGVFEGEHIELLEGRLVLMSPEGPRHAAVITTLNRLLVLALNGHAVVRPGNPLAVSDTSEPEPDFAVVAPGSFSASQHPQTALLAVEVSYSSLRKDRFYKPALYAAAGVREYWIVDLVSDTVTVLTDPTGGGYATVSTHVAGQSITLLAFPDVTIAVNDILAG